MRPPDAQIALAALVRARHASSRSRSRGVLLLGFAVALAAGWGSARCTTPRDTTLVADADPDDAEGPRAASRPRVGVR
jgi:hypothetical protein